MLNSSPFVDAASALQQYRSPLAKLAEESPFPSCSRRRQELNAEADSSGGVNAEKALD